MHLKFCDACDVSNFRNCSCFKISNILDNITDSTIMAEILMKTFYIHCVYCPHDVLCKECVLKVVNSTLDHVILKSKDSL